MEKKPIQFYILENKKVILTDLAKEQGITLTTLINNIINEYIKKNKLYRR